MNPISTGSHVTIRYFVTIQIKHIFDELLTFYESHIEHQKLLNFVIYKLIRQVYNEVNEYFEMPIRWSVIDRSERNQLKFYLRSLSLKIIQFLRVTGFCDMARKVFSFVPFVLS